jgi:PAS domain S-box-containing protein
MPAQLRLLVVTGDADKAQALVTGLRSPDVEPVWQWVTNEQELRDGLDAGTDVVLADEEYLPFGTLDVLRTLLEHSPHIPLIMVALGPSSDRVAEVMTRGAADVVRKDRLNGLGQAISDARDEFERRTVLVDLSRNELQRLSRAYQTLSQCNQALLRATDEATLLQTICNILTSIGGYRLAWVGVAEYDAARTVRPVAWAGHEDGYLSAIRVTWAEGDPLGEGPVGRAIRTREPQIVHFADTDPIFSPWREEALKRGYLSVIALPLIVEGEAFGALAVYASYAEAFDPREITLLQELAGDLAFGIETLRLRQERAEIEAALRESEEMYRLLAETARDIILVHDLEGRVRYVNAAGLEFAGYTMSEVRGRNIIEFLAPEYRAVAERNLRERQAGNTERFLYEVEMFNKAGQKIAMEVSSSPILHEGKPIAILIVARDISARRHAEELLQKQRAMAEAIANAAAALNSSLDLQSVLQGILSSAGQVVPHDSANIMLLDESKEYVYFPAHRGYRERGLADWLERQRWPVAQIANLREMMETLQPMIIPDVSAYPGWVDVPETRRVRSFASAPIQVGGEVIGFLNLDSETPNFYSEEHARPLMVFANHAAIALRNAQLYTSEKERSAELEQRVAERTQELQQSQALYQAIVQDQSELICRYTVHGTLIFVNRAYAEFFGQSAEALVGQRFLATLDAEQWEALAAQLAVLGPQQPVLETELQLADANGVPRWIQWINRLVLDAEGRPVGFQAVGRDITARHQFEESLQKALDHAMELNELKSRFVSMVSHEFRNPLAVMQTSVQMLQRYSDRLSEADKRRQLDTLQMYIRRMTDLLEEVLTISRAEAGKLAFNPEPVDVAALCRSIVDEIRTIAPPTLTFTVEAEGDCRAVADPRLLTLAVTNLVSNAAKYSKAQGTVRVGVYRQEHAVTVSVEDQGIGIPQREQGHVFEGFFRASNVGTLPGTGLGLLIARHCVMRHGGTLTFRSQENVGTIFTITVPLVPSSNGNGKSNNNEAR